MQSSKQRAKGTSLQPLKALVPFIRPYKNTLIFAIIILLLASAVTGSLPIAARYLIDSGITSGNADKINFYFKVVLGIILLISILSATRLYLITWLGERIVADLRKKIYAQVLKQDPSFFEVTQTGEVLSRLTTDTTLVQAISGVGISIALRSTVMLFMSLAGILYTSPSLALIMVLLIPAVIGPIIWLARRVRTLSRTAQDKIAESSGMANEMLNAIETVQAYTLETVQNQRFGKAVEAALIAAVERIKYRFVMSFSSMFLLLGAITLVLWMGTQEVLAGNMLPGELAQFVLFTVLLASSGAMLSEMWGEVQRAAGAMERLIELLNAQANICMPENPIPIPATGGGRISFNKVNFHYPSRPDSDALENFNLNITAGETIAFVGPSGAGKSTIFQLLLRFYDPQSGSITINGVDISAADPMDVRSVMAVVPQETVVFATSALENIRYGRPGASDDEVRAAAVSASADLFISQLPEGYHTFLGEKGTRLSGGQKQRIAIARAILKDPPILLLDEATSALDAESERLVQQSLQKLMHNRTTIIIAHRLATVLKAKRIVVIDDGRIQSIGSHAELMLKNPLYKHLAELQFRSAAQPIFQPH